MLFYILKRICIALPVALSACTLTFFLIHMVPGDPVDLMLGDQANVADRLALSQQLGLDKPLYLQYLQYLSGLVHLDLGQTFLTQRSVANEVAKHFIPTLELGFFALVLALTFALPLGVYSSLKHRELQDHILNNSSLLLFSLPSFFLGPILIWIFAIQLNWLPVSDRGGFLNLILPSATLAIPMAAAIYKMTRASILEQLRQQYLLVAKAKGVGRRQLYFKHALKNALLPIISLVGLQMGSLLTGAVITENIFDWPGLGSLLLQAVNRRDIPLFQGCVLLISLTYIVVNLATDILYKWAQPGVELE